LQNAAGYYIVVCRPICLKTDHAIIVNCKTRFSARATQTAEVHYLYACCDCETLIHWVCLTDQWPARNNCIAEICVFYRSYSVRIKRTIRLGKIRVF